MTTEDYYEIIEEESPSILPQFLTDAVRDLIYSIPYAQEMFLIFSKLYSLFYTFISLFIFIFVDNFLLIFILFESFTLIYASLSRDILQFFSRFAKMHIELFNFVISIIRSIVTTISSIVQALKPT
jgi:phage-related protein